MYDKHFVGLDLTGVQDNGIQRPISRVTLLLDDDNALTAGDDTGMELTASCPHATQAMVDAILTQVKGLEYRMFSADDARLDPAAELGDGVTAGGIYSVISRIDDDGSGYAGVAAPGEEELEDEYPAAGPTTQMFNRKIAQTHSRITKTAEQIKLEVTNEIKGLSSSIDIQLEGITQRVENNESGLSQTLRIAADGVTITNAQGSTLTIDGGQIDASRIKTEQLDASRIRAEDLNLTGAITWGDLAYDAKSQVTSAQDTASSALSAASSASAAANNAASVVGGWTYPGSTYINGAMLMTGTVKATSLQGGSVSLLNSSGSESGLISITGASSGMYAIDIRSYAALRLTALNGNLHLGSWNDLTWLQLRDTIIMTQGTLASNNGASLGNAAFKWGDIYSWNAAIQTSDRNEKEDIQSDLSDYDRLFDALKPSSFRLIGGQSGRTHLGLIAQDVELAMADSGISDMDFAGFIKSERQDGNGYDYALRYGEFIPLCIDQIQRLKARAAALERRLL